MTQSRLSSLTESLINVGTGYFIALATQLIVFPLFNLHVTISQNIAIGIIFTAISIIRSYVIRRLFNWLGTPH